MEAKYSVLAWLLESSDPTIRYLTIKNILGTSPDDPSYKKARAESTKNGDVAKILSKMSPEGYWVKPGGGYGPKYKSTVWALITLSQLGASIKDDARIDLACKYYLDNAFSKGGYISYNGRPAGTIDCLQGNMCAALTLLGCEDNRLEEAYDWMARTVTGEGIDQSPKSKSDRRYYAYKCGPCFACGANGKKPCAWGAVKVMLAFSLWPKEKRTKVISDAISVGSAFLLGQDIESATYPTGNNTPPNRSWWKLGFPVFYVTDILQNIEALVNLGFASHPNVQKALRRVLEMQNAEGTWNLEYDLTGKTLCNWGKMHQPNKYVTYRVNKVLTDCKKQTSH